MQDLYIHFTLAIRAMYIHESLLYIHYNLLHFNLKIILRYVYTKEKSTLKRVPFSTLKTRIFAYVPLVTSIFEIA